ncbi:MAG: ABC transporter permease [Bryobacterales bacterium]|nr:ABC transporter permease [Bryobacterales bacterium]
MTISGSENIRLALSAVWVHRFRSLLTVLGIVIGITTVVTVASLLSGVRRGVVTFFQELGPDNLFVYKTSGDPQSGGASEKEARRRPILPEYAGMLRDAATTLDDVSLQLFIPGIVGGRPISARVPGFESDAVTINGQAANLIDLSPREFAEGRYFTPDEEARRARVAAIGWDLAEALFPEGDRVGKTFLADGAEYTVVGVFEKAKGGFLGQNGIDTQIAIPLATARLRYPQIDRFMIVCKAKPGMRDEALEEVEGLLRKIRRTPPGEENDFALSTPDQIIQQFDKITGLIGLVAIALSALGLLVGGIGVMNVMLVSVTERTREIGTRMAIGARRRDIVGQFLAEAMTLTGIGGVLGIFVAIAITFLISALVPSLSSDVPPWAVAAAFLTSVSVGLFFGVWPAVKAARLDPVEALRYE